MTVLIVVALFFVFLIFALAVAAKMKGERKKRFKRGVFMTPAEKEFFRVLNVAVGAKYRLFGKVRLADILEPVADKYSKNSGWQMNFNKINGKHIDFLLCGPDFEPVCAVELDDRSHGAADRVSRDEFVESAFADCGLPLARFPVRRSYIEAEIKTAIENAIVKAATVSDEPVAQEASMSAPTGNAALAEPAKSKKEASKAYVSPLARHMAKDGPAEAGEPARALAAETAPTCPDCGRAMVRRKAGSGKNAGKEFWGCSGYPACGGIVSITQS